MTSRKLSRREFLRLGSLAAAGLAASRLPASFALQPSESALQPSGPVQGKALEIEMKATFADVAILPGASTRVLTYQARVLSGAADQLQSVPGSYLGPIIRMARGQRLRVNFINDLPEDTTVHFHGLTIPEGMAGHPHGDDIVHEGSTFVYEFDIIDRAGLYFFHPHPHMRIGYQVYHGLAGLLYVTDEEEAALSLPSGAQDVPVVIQDRTFDANNQLVYNAGGMGMAMMMGFMGNRVLVNGRPDYELSLAPGPNRLRLLNGSNARTYMLTWQNGMPFTVLGTDGGLLRSPVTRDRLVLAPGERLDLWLDLTSQKVGTELVLQGQSLGYGMMGGMGMMGTMSGTGTMAGTAGTMGGMGMMGGMGGMGRMGRMGGMGMMGGTGGMGGMGGMGMMGGMGGMGGITGMAGTSGASFPVLRVRVEGSAPPAAVLPTTLSAKELFRAEDAMNAASPRTFRLEMAHMAFLINGRSYEAEQVAEDEKIPLDTIEVWQYVNATPVPHPMHIHNTQFNVLERTIGAVPSYAYDSVRQGFVDEGWKDVVLVMPGETVKLLVKFSTYAGMFMYHCHILEHEDMGMMRNLMVGDSGAGHNMGG